MSWTWEETRLVGELLALKWSAAMIAAELGRSRSAIVGRIHRIPALRDMARPHGNYAGKPPKPRAPRPRHHKLARHPASAPINRPPRMRRLALKDLSHQQCRYAIEENPAVIGGHIFCGARTDFGAIYCSWHARLAYQGARHG